MDLYGSHKAPVALTVASAAFPADSIRRPVVALDFPIDFPPVDPLARNPLPRCPWLPELDRFIVSLMITPYNKARNTISYTPPTTKLIVLDIRGGEERDEEHLNGLGSSQAAVRQLMN